MEIKAQGIRLLPIAAVQSIIGLKKSSVHERIKAGLLPAAIPIGKRAVRYSSDEVQAVAEAMAAGLVDDEIRALIRRQHAARQARAAELRAA
jgi:predicted DNA-binding transcriptional regulator AlpA